MASSWIVLEAPAGATVAEGEELVFLRDGFSFLAFLFPPLWLLWHRLWVEAAVTFAVLIAAAGAEQLGGLIVSLPVQLVVSIFVGCEGNGLRIAASKRMLGSLSDAARRSSSRRNSIRSSTAVRRASDPIEATCARMPVAETALPGSALAGVRLSTLGSCRPPR